MSKASLLSNTATMRTLHCSLLLPDLNFCSEVYGVTYRKST